MSELHDGDVVEGIVADAWMAKSKAKGTPSLHLLTDCNGEEVHCDIWLTPKAMGMARQQFKALGIDIDRVTLAQVAANLNRLKSRKVQIEIQFDEWQGNITVKGSVYIAGHGGAVPDESEMDALTKALRAAGSDESKAKAATKDGLPPPAATKPAPPASRPAPTAAQKAAATTEAFPGEFDTDKIPF